MMCKDYIFKKIKAKQQQYKITKNEVKKKKIVRELNDLYGELYKRNKNT